MSRPKQKTFYLADDVLPLYNEFAQRYSVLGAQRGIDGNLQPYTLENGPKLTLDLDDEMVERAVQRVLAKRTHRRGPPARALQAG